MLFEKKLPTPLKNMEASLEQLEQSLCIGQEYLNNWTKCKKTNPSIMLQQVSQVLDHFQNLNEEIHQASNGSSLKNNNGQQLQCIETFLNLDENDDQFSSFLQCQIDYNIYANLDKSESQSKWHKKIPEFFELKQKSELENEINIMYQKYPDFEVKQEKKIEFKQLSNQEQNDFLIQGQESQQKFQFQLDLEENNNYQQKKNSLLFWPSSTQPRQFVNNQEIHIDLEENNKYEYKYNSNLFLFAPAQPNQFVNNDEIAKQNNNLFQENNQLELPIYPDFVQNSVFEFQQNNGEDSIQNLQNFSQNENMQVILPSENQGIVNMQMARRVNPFIIIKDYTFRRKIQKVENKKDEEMKQKHKIRGPYKRYTVQQKQEIIDQATNEENIKCLSKRVAIDAKTIKRWKEKGAYRQKGGGRKVQVICIQLLLKKLAKERSNVEDFKASKGWYAKFNSRFKFDEYEDKFLAQFKK